MQSYNDYIELRERVLMSKKLDQVGLETTTFAFPCLRSFQLSYWSDNGTEASETYITITRIEFIQCYTVYGDIVGHSLPVGGSNPLASSSDISALSYFLLHISAYSLLSPDHQLIIWISEMIYRYAVVQ